MFRRHAKCMSGEEHEGRARRGEEGRGYMTDIKM